MSAREKASQSKTSGELEHEVESTRAGLTATLDEIKERLSPASIADQVFDITMINGGSRFATSLGQSVRDDPVPTLLIGTGLAWLLASASGGRSDEDADTPGRSRTPTHSIARTEDADGSCASMAVGSRAKSGMDIRGPAAKNVDDLYAAAACAIGQTGEAAGKAELTLRESGPGYEGSTALREAQPIFENGRQGTKTMFERQPLVLGAIGFAVGAAIGAALPATHAENRWMGESSDELKRRAREIAEDQYDNVREIAGQIYDGVRDEVKAERLGDIPAESITQATERIGAAAEGAISTAEESAKEAVDSVKKAASGSSEVTRRDTSTQPERGGSGAPQAPSDFRIQGTTRPRQSS
jgi:hypothetical protein